MIKDYTVEHNLVGSLLLDSAEWISVRSILRSNDFKDKACADVFEALEKMEGVGSQTTVGKYLKDKYQKSHVEFLADLVISCDQRDLVVCAKQIKEDAKKERFQKIIKNFQNTNSDEDVNAMVKRMQNEFVSLIDDDDKTFVGPKELAFDILEYVQMMKDRGCTISGLTTGYRIIDKITDGLKPCELIVIGARPSQGKSSLMVCMAKHISMDIKKKAAIFSMETGQRELMVKFLSIMTRIENRKINHGEVESDYEYLITRAANMIGESGLYVNDIGGLDLMKIRAHLKLMINKGIVPDIVFVDYLGLVGIDDSNLSYPVKIGNITKGLKGIAKELNIPVVLLCQINRANGQDRPRLMDLKDSGSIEADCDIAMLLHREEFYKGADCETDLKGMIEINIAKNRNGPVETVKLKWVGHSTTIEE